MSQPLARCCVNKRPRPHGPLSPWLAAPEPLAAYRLPVREQAALVTASRWEPGKKLRILFTDGVPVPLMDELVKAAAEWSLHANIDFAVVGTGDAEIRVSSNPNGGSWSFIGKGCLQVPANEPTLNLGWPDDYARSLHELGHALGLIHEHENPMAKIPWRVAAVIAYYQQTQGWSVQEIVDQVLTPDNHPLTNGGYDKTSIMEYPIPAELVSDPSFAVGWNQVLSPKDLAFIAQVYPGRQATPPTPPPAPNTPPSGDGATGVILQIPAAGDYLLTVTPAKR